MTSAALDVLSNLKRHGQAVEAYMRDALQRQTQAPALLIQAMDYSLMAGGKRLRPTHRGQAPGEGDQALQQRAVGVLQRAALPFAGRRETVHQPQGLRRCDGHPRGRCDGQPRVRVDRD